MRCLNSILRLARLVRFGPILLKKPAIVSVGNQPFSAGRGNDASWSNPMRMTGQVKCKWAGKSVRLTNVRTTLTTAVVSV